MVALAHLVWDAEVHHCLSGDDVEVFSVASAEVLGVICRICGWLFGHGPILARGAGSRNQTAPHATRGHSCGAKGLFEQADDLPDLLGPLYGPPCRPGGRSTGRPLSP